MKSATGMVVLVLASALSWVAAQEPAPSATPPPAGPTPVAIKLTPEELRANERAIILALQTVMLGERTYAVANGGLFDQFGCLAEPWKCIPGYAADAAPFLDPTYDWLETRLGYHRKFYPGPRPTPDELARAKASPSSIKSYAYTATPVRPETGLRGMCADSKGRICVTDDGREPSVKDGLCDPCKKLQ